jgi:hypothetical protein
MSRFKPSERQSLQFSRESVGDSDKTGNFKISLAYFDPSPMYASGFKDWQRVGLLSKALETLQGYCKQPLRRQIDGDKFAVYQSFPPADKTMFEYPKHVPEDAEWARIHVNGASVLIGHIVGDTFYLVFLDKTHKFWLTKKVTGK